MVDRETIDGLAKDGTLTPRQAEVAILLSEDRTAREIADELGITRNAVYSQITALKKKGLFDSQYTPSGEVRTPARSNAAAMLDHVTGAVEKTNGGTSRATEMEVIRELVAQNKKLLEMVDRLTS